MRRKVVVSYELTLPQNIYPKLDRLFSAFRWETKRVIKDGWNKETLKLLEEKGSACSVLKGIVQRPSYLPSRFYRSVLEMAGEILRSQIERKEIYEYIAQKPCRSFMDETLIARELKTSPLFVLNVQRQVRNSLKKGKLERDYLKLKEPDFSGNVVITSADDSLCRGQFRKLKFFGDFLEFEIKVPDGKGWRWIKVRKLVPERLRKALEKAVAVKSPLIKRVFLKSGYTIYRLVIPVEMEVEVPDEVEKVFALDLSPSEKRLGVGVVVSKGEHSKPVFFKALKTIRKLERLLKEISALERKIDRIADQMHFTTSRKHGERLEKRLKHLFLEQKLKQRKFKELRKQLLEVFVNLVIEHAVAYGCEAAAVERLSFKEIPGWKDPKMRRHFAMWFYSRFEERLRHKAERRGLRVISVPAGWTSRRCHVCGKVGRLEGLRFVCENCKKTFDRDYNAGVNIGMRALKVSGSKSEPYRGEDTPARFPSPQGTAHLKMRALLSILPLTVLLSYLRLIETSYLKLKTLLKYLQVDKYG